jgi:hypothetical protein
MSYMLRLGFICQKVKTSPPAQVQKFCGMLWDSHRVPKVVVIPDSKISCALATIEYMLMLPDSKISCALATIEYMLMLDDQGIISRLSAAVGGGLLRSLVDATPARQGQTYLRGLYDDVHLTSNKYGRELYYSVMKMAESTRADLRWWVDFLQQNPGNCSPTGSMGNMVVTWGDGSGTGTGGTSEALNQPPGRLETWMGTWETHVRHYDLNWRELRTLLHKMERKVTQGEEELRGLTPFYFTDNMVTYYIVHNGSSRSPELHKLIRRIKLLELQLGCRVEVIHVPGVTMISEGTDGLSRGVWVAADRIARSSLEESRLALQGVPFSYALSQWVGQILQLAPETTFAHHDDHININTLISNLKFEHWLLPMEA